MRAALALLSLIAAILPAGCGYPPNPAARPQNILDFKTLYAQNCSACHGVDGSNGPATDLANPEYEALIDDASLRHWISAGMPGTQMPAFAQSSGGMLTDAQIGSIVSGMRQQWSRANPFSGIAPPAYTQNQSGDLNRGRQVYQARCAICHAQTNEQIASSIYLALTSDQALRSLIIAGSPDIGQPDWRHDSKGAQPAPPLSDQQINDVIAWLASLRNASPTYAGSPGVQQPSPAGGQNK